MLESRFPDHLRTTETEGNKAVCPLCHETFIVDQLVIKTNCNHVMHGPCLLEYLDCKRHLQKLDMNVVCPCGGCGTYETPEDKHFVEVYDKLNGNSTSFMKNKDIATLRETPELMMTEGLPDGWTKNSDTSFQHKVVMIPGVARVKDQTEKHTEGDPVNLTKSSNASSKPK